MNNKKFCKFIQNLFSFIRFSLPLEKGGGMAKCAKINLGTTPFPPFCWSDSSMMRKNAFGRIIDPDERKDHKMAAPIIKGRMKGERQIGLTERRLVGFFSVKSTSFHSRGYVQNHRIPPYFLLIYLIQSLESFHFPFSISPFSILALPFSPLGIINAICFLARLVPAI